MTLERNSPITYLLHLCTFAIDKPRGTVVTNVHETSNDRVSPSWFVQLDLDKPFCLSMLDKILDLQRYGEGGGKEGRKEVKRGGGEIKRDKEKRGEEWGGIKRERGRRNKEGHSGEEREREGVEKHQLHSDIHNPQLCKPLWLDQGGWDDLPDQGTLHTRYLTSQCLDDARHVHKTNKHCILRNSDSNLNAPTLVIGTKLLKTPMKIWLLDGSLHCIYTFN